MVGGKVSQLEKSSPGLFALCAEESWQRIEQCLLAYDLVSSTWELVTETSPIGWSGGAVLLPIGRLANELSVHLIGNRSTRQKALDFPLMRVPTTKKNASKRAAA
jgi:hypothetical protein